MGKAATRDQHRIAKIEKAEAIDAICGALNRKRRNAALAKWRKANPDKAAASEASWRKAHPGAKNAASARHYAWRQKTKETAAGRPRPKACEQCGRTGTAHFDHCHATDKFRGWLCFQCNAALGLVGNSPELLIKLAKYLKRAAKQSAKK